MKTVADIRAEFLKFFEERDHQVVTSSSLVPANDPTLLFTNAGMVQFKDVFLGAETRSYTRATSSQRCVRAGGKHNDLDQVGYTARHHTFFEMLGNFSFGDYFKRDAIAMAWTFLTEVAGLDPARLWVTVYEEDDEAADIWLKDIGVSRERFSRIGAKDNFWAMGDTGPCGPCTEIFFDHGPDIAGGPPGTPEEDGDRYVEIWNLVFMQFDRAADGSLAPLPAPCVDTGMGLERLAAVLQGVHSNYDTDLFRALIEAAAERTNARDPNDASLKVIADHIRSCAFMIVDGVLPSNEGRGYVLRRIIRRAIRHGYKLGCNAPFFADMTLPLVEQMGEAYPELKAKATLVQDTLAREEARFAETLEQGMRLLERSISDLTDDQIPGPTAFKLYDTYGFPIDLTADIARERGLRVDQAGFDACMQEQRDRARSEKRFAGKGHVDAAVLSELPATRFTGYDGLRGAGTVLAILVDQKPVPEVTAGEEAIIVLDETPFYAESGGQVGDHGSLRGGAGQFTVVNTTKLAGEVFGHHGQVADGRVAVGDAVQLSVESQRRRATILNHSATHLMHAALREVLGSHVEQKGSYVGPDRLRFDFSHFQPMTREELQRVERMVNAQIRRNDAAAADVMPFDDAVAAGAMALFGEKYGETVRVMRFGEFSCELCGGTHVERTGDIGLFKIISETGIASGVRRIEAVTGDAALDHVADLEDQQLKVAQALKADARGVLRKIEQLQESERELKRQIDSLQSKLAEGAGRSLADEAVRIGDIKVLCATADAANAGGLRTMADDLKARLKPAVIVLGAAFGDKAQLVASVSPELEEQVPARDLVQAAAAEIDGRGGGRKDFAQAGGGKTAGLESALKAARDWVEQRLA